MKKYLAIDSGGTKILAILYDEEFRPVKTIRVGSCRGNTTTDEMIEYHMAQFVKELALKQGTIIDCITGVADAVLIEYLKKYYNILDVNIIGELDAGLAAAGLFDNSLLALSGTGAQLSARYHGEFYVGGAYGAAISDLGSGYWIGRTAMEAAIADFEGYGEYTILTDWFAEKYGGSRENFRDSVMRMYASTEHSPVSQVAACAGLVSEAARKGDTCARRILRDAGKSLGIQLAALIRKHHFPDELPITISGSVWKSDRILFDSFAECIKEQCPNRQIIIPTFEPIIGFMILHHNKIHHGYTQEDKEKLEKLYPEFLFNQI